MITYSDDEIEQDRKDAVKRLSEEFEEPLDSIRDRYQSEFGYHEVLHTSHIFMENLESYLMEHPAVMLDEQAFRLAHQAHTALFNLYQHLGQLRFVDKDESNEYEEAIKQLEKFVHRDGDQFVLEAGAEKGIDPVVFADLKRSLGVTNKLIERGEINADDIEITPKRPTTWWNMINVHLQQAAIKPEVKSSLQNTINFFAQAEEEDDDDFAVPLSGSFYVLIRLLELHPNLPAPSLGIDPDGLFNAIWQDTQHRWSLRFRPWDIDHSDTPIDPNDPGAWKTQRNILVTEVIRGESGATGVSSIEQALAEIVVPEWI